jgi:large subunit ribosomal protein L23
MSLSPETIIKRPIALTEKATRQKIDHNQVVFEVALTANKIQIRDAVEKLFEVEVASVNTLVQRGKSKRMGRRTAKRKNWKKAIVTLKEGSDIQLFEESAEEE